MFICFVKSDKKYIGDKADRILLKSVKLDTDSEIIELIMSQYLFINVEVITMLTKAEKDYIIELLDKGERIPEDFKYKLFPVEHKEYELAYAGKMRKEDLLADDDGSFPVPLQLEKVFNGQEDLSNDGWKNMIVFGDNLQFLKTVYKNEDPIIKDKVKGKVKLIYIDPPFATSDDF